MNFDAFNDKRYRPNEKMKTQIVTDTEVLISNFEEILLNNDEKAQEMWDFNFDVELELNSMAINYDYKTRPYFFQIDPEK